MGWPSPKRSRRHGELIDAAEMTCIEAMIADGTLTDHGELAMFRRRFAVWKALQLQQVEQQLRACARGDDFTAVKVPDFSALLGDVSDAVHRRDRFGLVKAR
jgi:hypothetical protein